MNKLLTIIAASNFLISTPLSFNLEQTINGQVSTILNNETNNLQNKNNLKIDLSSVTYTKTLNQTELNSKQKTYFDASSAITILDLDSYGLTKKQFLDLVPTVNFSLAKNEIVIDNHKFKGRENVLYRNLNIGIDNMSAKRSPLISGYSVTNNLYKKAYYFAWFSLYWENNKIKLLFSFDKIKSVENVEESNVTFNLKFKYIQLVPSKFYFKKLNKIIMSKFPRIVDFDKRDETITNDEFKSKIKNKLIILLQNIIGNDYEVLEDFIENIIYDELNEKVSVVFSQHNIENKTKELWKISFKINWVASEEYWVNSMKKRLIIIPTNYGDISKNEEKKESQYLETNKGLIYNNPIIIKFNKLNQNEFFYINGKLIEDKNKEITYKVNPDLIKKNYEIKIIKYDEYHKQIATYCINILIDQIAKALELNSLNRNSEILWVDDNYRNNDFYDPLDANNNLVKNNSTNNGMLAQGIVAKDFFVEDVNYLYKDTIIRYKLNKSLTLDNNTDIINVNNKNKIVDPGIYYYIEKNKFGLFTNRYVFLTKNNYFQNFSEEIRNPKVKNFWSTIHGSHLKQYLWDIHHLKSEDIKKLTFDEVAIYWRNYVYDIKNNIYHLNPKNNILDLSNIEELKKEFLIRGDDLLGLKKQIINLLIIKLNKYNLKYLSDYQIFIGNKNIEDCQQEILPLLDFNAQDSANLLIRIQAMPTSLNLQGQTVVNFINHRNLNNLINITNSSLNSFEDNFKNYSVEDFKKYVINYINNYFYKVNNLCIEAGIDYNINWNNIKINDWLKYGKDNPLEIRLTAINNSNWIRGTKLISIINNANLVKQNLTKEDLTYFQKNVKWLMPLIALGVLMLIFSSYVLIHKLKKYIKNGKK